MRRRLALMSVGIGLAIGAWLGIRAVESRRFRGDLARARVEFGAGRFAGARGLLVRLAERRPGDGEVELLRGECERRLGHPDAALAAWGRAASITANVSSSSAAETNHASNALGGA